MKVYIDMQVPFPYLTEDLIEQFQVMEPFGKGNKRPLFAEKDLKVIQPKIVGKTRMFCSVYWKISREIV